MFRFAAGYGIVVSQFLNRRLQDNEVADVDAVVDDVCLVQ
jgi:hypothetical protein